MSDALGLSDLGGLAWRVALAVLPLAVLFMIFQLLFLKLPRREVFRILTVEQEASISKVRIKLSSDLIVIPASAMKARSGFQQMHYCVVRSIVSPRDACLPVLNLIRPLCR